MPAISSLHCDRGEVKLGEVRVSAVDEGAPSLSPSAPHRCRDGRRHRPVRPLREADRHAGL